MKIDFIEEKIKVDPLEMFIRNDNRRIISTIHKFVKDIYPDEFGLGIYFMCYHDNNKTNRLKLVDKNHSGIVVMVNSHASDTDDGRFSFRVFLVENGLIHSMTKPANDCFMLELISGEVAEVSSLEHSWFICNNKYFETYENDLVIDEQTEILLSKEGVGGQFFDFKVLTKKGLLIHRRKIIENGCFIGPTKWKLCLNT